MMTNDQLLAAVNGGEDRDVADVQVNMTRAGRAV